MTAQVMPPPSKQRKKSRGRGGDGVKYLGIRNGEKWWQARLTLIDPQTRKKRDTTDTYAAESRALAVQERTRLLRNLKGQAVAQRKRFNAVVTEWLASIKSFGTRKNYRTRVGRVPPAWDERWIDTITTRDVQAFLGHLTRLDGKPFGRGTVDGIRDGLVALWKFAQWKGYVTSNVVKGTLRESVGRTQADALAENAGKKDKRHLTDVEAVQLILWFQSNVPELYPLVLATFVLGCRFAEVSAIRRDCLDVATGAVWIAWGQCNGRVGPTKGKRRRRAGLGAIALGVVRAHLARMDALKWPGHDVLVFPSPPTLQGRIKISDHWSYETVRLAYHRAFEALGFTMANATHCARHTMSNLANQEAAGAQISQRLVDMTVGMSANIARTYRHPEVSEVVQLAGLVEGRLAGLVGPESCKVESGPENGVLH